MKYLKALASIIVYLAVYVLVYAMHVRFFTVDVVFYAALVDAVVAVVLTAGLLLPWARVSADFTGLEKAQMAALWLALGYILAISVPTVLDRSLSFYILEKLQQRNGVIAHSDFERVFTEEYMREHRLVDVRLTEQLASGTLVIRDGCVHLTPRGDRLATLSRGFRRHFLPKRRLLMGEYTDALVDPFKDSHLAKLSGDTCRPSPPPPR